MNLSDIIVLAKQGYKPEDIKELIKLSEQPAQNPPDQGQSEGANREDVAEDENAAAANEQKPDNTAGEKQSEDINYKELYEKSQADLAKAQKFNTSQTLSQPNQKTDEDIFSEAVKGFY